VGDATAREAERAGFLRIERAGGDVIALAGLVAVKADPTRGSLLHVTGRHVAGDLAGRLAAQGFAVRRAPLYEARAARVLSPQLVTMLSGNAIDLALFFSPRTAATFVSLVAEAGIGDLSAVRAYALSAAVAKALEPIGWRAMRVAGSPTQEALLAVLDADRGGLDKD
jgi:uroporphyrinogen-III synthase